MPDHDCGETPLNASTTLRFTAMMQQGGLGEPESSMIRAQAAVAAREREWFSASQL
jgi:hypothetical protein